MNCPKCGTPPPELASFCIECGAALSQAASLNPSPASAAPPAPEIPSGSGAGRKTPQAPHRSRGPVFIGIVVGLAAGAGIAFAIQYHFRSSRSAVAESPVGNDRPAPRPVVMPPSRSEAGPGVRLLGKIPPEFVNTFEHIDRLNEMHELNRQDLIERWENSKGEKSAVKPEGKPASMPWDACISWRRRNSYGWFSEDSTLFAFPARRGALEEGGSTQKLLVINGRPHELDGIRGGWRDALRSDQGSPEAAYSVEFNGHPSGFLRVRRATGDYKFVPDVVRSADGLHVGFIYGGHLLDGVRCSITIDGTVKAQAQDFGLFEHLVLSRDASRYSAIEMSGDTVWWVVNGPDESSPDKPVDLRMSSSGRSLAYAIQVTAGGFEVGKGWFVVLWDGVAASRFGPFEAVGPPVFSPVGEALAFRARAGGREFVIHEGRRHELFDEVSDPVFRPDGKGVAYAATLSSVGAQGEDPVRKAFVVVDGVPLKGPSFLRVDGIRHSEDGRHLAYCGFRPGGWSIVLDDRELESGWDGVDAPVFSPDGRRIAFAAMKLKEGSYISVPGARSGPYERVQSKPWFTPDGSQVVFGCVSDSEIWRRTLDVDPWKPVTPDEQKQIDAMWRKRVLHEKFSKDLEER